MQRPSLSTGTPREPAAIEAINVCVDGGGGGGGSYLVAGVAALAGYCFGAVARPAFFFVSDGGNSLCLGLFLVGVACVGCLAIFAVFDLFHMRPYYSFVAVNVVV
jgi:hypothetical protein